MKMEIMQIFYEFTWKNKRKHFVAATVLIYKLDELEKSKNQVLNLHNLEKS